MHRIDTVGSEGGAFVDRDPVLGKPGTKVDAAIMNALQEELAGFIESAGVTLEKGTNTQLASALATWLQNYTHTIVGAAGDANAAIVLGGTPATRKLKAQLSGDGMHARIYANVDGELEITINARWTGTEWASDQIGSAVKVELVFGGLVFKRFSASGSNWAEASWTRGLSVQSDDSSLLSTTAITNEVRAANVCKAWASVYYNAGGGEGPADIRGGINASGVSTASGEVTITFASAMADTNYAVSFACDNSGTTPITPRIKTKNTGSLVVKFLDFTGAAVSAFDGTATGILKLDVTVFGKQ